MAKKHNFQFGKGTIGGRNRRKPTNRAKSRGYARGGQLGDYKMAQVNNRVRGGNNLPTFNPSDRNNCCWEAMDAFNQCMSMTGASDQCYSNSVCNCQMLDWGNQSYCQCSIQSGFGNQLAQCCEGGYMGPINSRPGGPRPG